jgi:hypothetical protein
MTTNKFLLLIFLTFIVGYFSGWVYNHINAWLGFLMIGMYFYFLFLYIKKNFFNH